jgi:hypothetical protein
MIRRLLIGFGLFVVAAFGYLSVSGAPPRVHVVTLVPWFVIVALASLIAWSRQCSLLTRLVLLALLVVAGAGLLLYATTASFGKMEPSIGSYVGFVVLTILVLGAFLALAEGLARLVDRWWPEPTRT